MKIQEPLFMTDSIHVQFMRKYPIIYIEKQQWRYQWCHLYAFFTDSVRNFKYRSTVIINCLKILLFLSIPIDNCLFKVNDKDTLVAWINVLKSILFVSLLFFLLFLRDIFTGRHGGLLFQPYICDVVINS